MSSVKVLHIPNYYPPHIGGIEDVCYNVVTAMPDYNHRVMCFHDQKATCKDEVEGVPVVRAGVVKKLFSQSISFSYYKELKKLFKEFNPDIVHFHTPNPLGSVYLLSLLPKKTKLIIHWHSDIIEQDLLYTFYRPIEKKLLKRADKILMTSPTYLTGSPALNPWKDKLDVIPNTINTAKLDKQDGDDAGIARIKQLYPGKKIIFTFGRHVPYKGLRYLIEAAPLLNDDAVVVIAGKGPLTGKLKEMAAPVPNVHFIGRVSNDDLRYYLHASDIFAFPSITRNEAFGLALAEAMYCGLPAVTYTIAHSGVNYVSIDKETGIEVENRNVQQLADAFNKLLDDEELREELSSNAVQRVNENFVNEAIKGKLDTIYLQMTQD
jgi:Glycosyltransferase